MHAGGVPASARPANCRRGGYPNEGHPSGRHPAHGRSPELEPQLNLSRAVRSPPNKVSHRQLHQRQCDPRIRNQEPPTDSRLADPDHLITLPKGVKDEAHPLGTDIKVPALIRGACAHLRVPLTETTPARHRAHHLPPPRPPPQTKQHTAPKPRDRHHSCSFQRDDRAQPSTSSTRQHPNNRHIKNQSQPPTLLPSQKTQPPTQPNTTHKPPTTRTGDGA